MTIAESSTICGFSLIDGSLCIDAVANPKSFCSVHETLPCAACNGRAVQYCPAKSGNGSPCGKPLCERCEHQINDRHGRKATVRDTARADLIKATVLSIQDAEDKGMLKTQVPYDQIAGLLIDQLSMHVMMKILSGMAQPPS